MVHGKMPDGGAICLIDNDRLLIVLSQNIPTGARPARELDEIGLAEKVHTLSLQAN
jgi:hypothetical protein